MKKYNKDDLVKSYKELKKADGKVVNEREAKEDVDTLLSALMQTLAQAKDEQPCDKNVRARMTLVNFGTFELKRVKERKYNNIQYPDKEPVIKPEHNNVVISIGKVFEESIN